MISKLKTEALKAVSGGIVGGERVQVLVGYDSVTDTYNFVVYNSETDDSILLREISAELFDRLNATPLSSLA